MTFVITHRFDRRWLCGCLLFFLFACTACLSNTDPKERVTNFIKAMQNNNFAEAKNYVTKESYPLLDAMATTPDKHLFPVAQNETFVISNIKKQDDDLLLTITINETHQQLNLLLKKQSGEWKVAYDMGTLMKSIFDN